MAKIVAGQSELIYISNAKTWNCSVQELIESLAAKTAANSRKHPYPANKTEQDLMKHLLLLGALILPLGSAHAYAPYKDGTIYPQLVVGCDDHLNRALLKELHPLNNQGDEERAP